MVSWQRSVWLPASYRPHGGVGLTKRAVDPGKVNGGPLGC